jgi:mannose-6-phosphate isomerase-like protein (cupin superfamily)
MNVQEYIDSGVLHDYCIHALTAAEKAEVEKMCARYPEVQEELSRMQEDLEKFAAQTEVWPPVQIKETIWSTLENLNKEKTGDLNDLPEINKYTDHNNWKRIVMPFMPQDLKNDRIVKTIRESAGITQMLIVSKTDVEEETHENEHESFIILEGECECLVGNKVIRLGPGGFLEIPLHTLHSVKVTSAYVVAVLQHIAI